MNTNKEKSEYNNKINKFREVIKEMITNGKLFIWTKDNIEKQLSIISEFIRHDIAPSYKLYLEEAGCAIFNNCNGFDFEGLSMGKIPSVVNATNKDRKFFTETIPDKAPPDSYILISDIGDEVQWYMDTAIVDEFGESPIVGWIGGLSLKDQPAWLKEQEYFDNFMEFFLTKTEENNV
jgi:hypothetical protein